ncbi:MAG: hypothetical protein KF788_07240 [Piscinibacter sp.]|nr:hypothetical protein [Piscinibacter sp.]
MHPHQLAAALLGVAAAAAAAQPARRVYVNGLRMDTAALARLDRAACTRIPDGAYWLNTRNGAWGYAGNPTVQGVIGDACSATGGTGGQVAGDGTYGPYATMRRANEVANDLRRRGLRAVTFHNGDGYYVRASR